MKIWFGQIYIEPGVSFPFSYRFQHRLSEEVTALVLPSAKFIDTYGSDFELMFRISAKRGIEDNEIKGPTVFRKSHDVEYTVFLPFDAIMCKSQVPQSALRLLLMGIRVVLQALEIDTAGIAARQEALIEHICSDPEMFEEPS
jgi:hypothetical protein